MLKKFAFALLAAVSVPVFAGNPHVSKEVNRFTKAVSIIYSPDASRETMQAHFLAVRESGQASWEEGIYLTRASDEWHYLDCHSLHWLVDDQPVDMPGEFGSQMLNGGNGVLETFNVRLSETEMDRLARAKKIEFEVCNDDFQFTNQDMQGLRDVLAEKAAVK